MTVFFEVHTLTGKRWVLDHTAETQIEAIEGAKSVFGRGRVEGVQVRRCRAQPDGGQTSIIIFNDMRARGRTVSVAAVEEAQWCRTTTDLLSFPGRQTIFRVLRRYFDDAVLTPSEVLHHPRVARRLMESPLYPAAVDRVSTFLAKAHGQNARALRDDLLALCDRALARIKTLDAMPALADVAALDLAAMMATVRGAVARLAPEAGQRKDAAADTASAMGVVLARNLVAERDWVGKLDMLLSLMAQSPDPIAATVLDAFIADTLNARAVVQDLLGERESLADALLGLLDLLEGIPVPAALEHAPLTVSLRRLFADARLPQSRAALLERVRNEVRGGQKLTRKDPNREEPAFATLLGRVFHDAGLLGGDDMAAALTERFATRVPEGGHTGWRKSVQGMTDILTNNRDRLFYLLAIAGHPRSLAQPDLVPRGISTIAAQVYGVEALSKVINYSGDWLPVLAAMHAKAQIAPIGEPARAAISRMIDDLLGHVALGGPILALERIEPPALRERTLRLLDLCRPGVLPDGKGRALLWSRAREEMRRQAFLVRYLDGLLGKQQDTALRALHAALSQKEAAAETSQA